MRNNLGVCYYYGEGVPKDLRRAVDLGDTEAINNLGLCNEKGAGVPKDEKKAVHLYKQAADMQKYPWRYLCVIDET